MSLDTEDYSQKDIKHVNIMEFLKDENITTGKVEGNGYNYR